MLKLLLKLYIKFSLGLSIYVNIFLKKVSLSSKKRVENGPH